MDPHSYHYNVIEVNPRVSRSSALASKATGYPIAKLAAKIAVGLTLDEIKNPVTQTTWAQFEPALDYVVCKIPRWPFDKFTQADRQLGSQMKATGEVMAIGRTAEEALQKAVRSLEIDETDLISPAAAAASDKQLQAKLTTPQDDRLFYLAEAFRRGMTIEEVHALTQITPYFLDLIQHLVEIEHQLKTHLNNEALLRTAKKYGFADQTIAKLWGTSAAELRQKRQQLGLVPVYKMVDTCAAEFDSTTPYFYSTYETENESHRSDKPAILVIGSGPIRIGQGVEFDYATVHSVHAIQALGYEAIVMNSNPETVSTDFSVSDKLYFEPLTLEDVLNVIDVEQPVGVIVQFGGQTAINLADGLAQNGVKILGTTVTDLNAAEDREVFDQVITDLGLKQPVGLTATTKEGVLAAAAQIGYPVLVRPSYVLGGKAMEIVNSPQELKNYLAQNAPAAVDHPILVDAYLEGKECEVDAICDGTNVLLPGIMEHIERAGVHSGDSMAVYPPQSFGDDIKAQIVAATKKLAVALKCIGIMNIQFIIHDHEAYVLEVNPRASRTVPFLSKITGIEMAQVATKVILGQSLSDQGYQGGLAPDSPLVHVKAPVFSFSKLDAVDAYLGPEMKSTGEVMGTDANFAKALYKAFAGAKMQLPLNGTVLLTVEDHDKKQVKALAKRFARIGYRILATKGTAKYLKKHGLHVTKVQRVHDQAAPTILDVIKAGQVNLVINTMGHDYEHTSDGFIIRQTAIEHNVPLLTALDTVDALLRSLEGRSFATSEL